MFREALGFERKEGRRLKKKCSVPYLSWLAHSLRLAALLDDMDMTTERLRVL